MICCLFVYSIYNWCSSDPFVFSNTVLLLSEGKTEKKAVVVEHVQDAPQQQNGYDCGMYTVLLAERFASRKSDRSSTEDSSSSNASTSRGESRMVPQSSPQPQPPSLATKPPSITDGHEKEESGKRKRLTVAGVRGSIGVGGNGGGGPSGGELSIQDISPVFVSDARRLALERLKACIRATGK